MKSIIVLCVMVAVAAARPGESYNSRYDDFNVQEVADNIRLLKSYGRCFEDEGPCTAEGSEFKKTIPDALQTTCAKCNPKQEQLVRTVVKAFQTKLPDVWERLVKKYDPTGEYKESFNNFINAN